MRKTRQDKAFEKLAKYYGKSDRLHLQRSGDFYYICNGYTAMKVNKSVYAVYFRVNNARFKEMNDGERWEVAVDLETRPGMEISRLFEDCGKYELLRSYRGNIREVTCRLFGDKPQLLALIEADNTTPVQLNYEWFCMFRDVLYDSYYTAGDSTASPVYARGDLDTEAVILPVRY